MANKSERICIIGGGPAGVAAAMYLQNKGYENYEIYEKLWKVGGSIYSPKIYMNARDYAFETGDISAKISTDFIKDAEEFTNEKFKSENQNLRLIDSLNNEIYPFNIKKEFSFKKFFYNKRLKKEIEKLKRIIDNPDNEDLSLTFKEFCKKKKLKKISEYLSLSIIPFSNGQIDDIAAVFVINRLKNYDIYDIKNMNLTLWDEGAQNIFKRINEDLIHPANVNSEVRKVQHPAPGTLGKIKVTIRYKGNERVEEFDKLILAGDFDEYAKYSDIADEGKKIFERIKYKGLVSFLAVFADGKNPDKSGYIYENRCIENNGHAFMILKNRDDIKDNCPCTVYACRNDEISLDENLILMANDINALGYHVKERLYEQEIRCFPYLTFDEGNDISFTKLDKLQGKQNTYYIGNILDSISPEGICASSKEIVERFFPKDE